MKSAHTIAALVIVTSLAAHASAQSLETPTYTTAKVVSFDLQNRMMVIRASDGRAQSVKLDDSVAGFPVGLRTGDTVILSLRSEVGLPRVSSIVKSVPPSAIRPAAPPAAAAVRPPTPTEPTTATVVLVGADSPAGRAFEERVAAIALDANRVDGLWSSFRNSCDAQVTGSFSGSREWTALWT